MHLSSSTTPSIGAYGGFGSLLLAARKAGHLVYVGSVGTGFKEREANALRKMMDKLTWKRKAPPIAYSGKRQVVWQQPTPKTTDVARQSTRSPGRPPLATTWWYSGSLILGADNECYRNSDVKKQMCLFGTYAVLISTSDTNPSNRIAVLASLRC
ncbi:hypothetical protein FHT77_000463 [Rhizobium sp. BK181]|uniref:ATP dependent DNA ligase n=1 Tax=Rhizobium sp. BK181 TaxID=2587072 RepID=UPI0016199A85|nr:hypothetical protein [Rhizobium sp. BK181]MBB3314621.1 hypothetical protein [Rhizobium sp. BK181]